MAEKLQVYKCDICGNIVEVLHGGAGSLVCCGQPMKLMEEKKEDQGKEKHVPVMERKGNLLVVKVGAVPHPMEEKHYIEWVQVLTEKGAYRKFLVPGQAPEAQFEISEPVLRVREFCNVHGLWSAKS